MGDSISVTGDLSRDFRRHSRTGQLRRRKMTEAVKAFLAHCPTAPLVVGLPRYTCRDFCPAHQPLKTHAESGFSRSCLISQAREDWCCGNATRLFFQPLREGRMDGKRQRRTRLGRFNPKDAAFHVEIAP